MMCHNNPYYQYIHNSFSIKHAIYLCFMQFFEFFYISNGWHGI